MAGETTTIRTEITTEDLSSEVLQNVQGELANTDEAVAETNAGFAAWAQGTVQFLHNIGINLVDVGARVYEFGRSFVDAAAAGQQADTAVAGLIRTVQGVPWDQAIGDAQALGDSLDQIAFDSGAFGDIGGAFEQLILYTGATRDGVEDATDRIADMAQISRILGRDVGSVTQEFALMMEGSIKVKGQLFQLLQATGRFGDDGKKAAAAWAKMTDEERVNLLNAALSDVVGRVKDIPKTFNNYSNSIASLMDVTREQVGEPFMEALMPALEEAVSVLQEMKPELVELAQTLGKDVADAVRTGLKMFKEGVQWLKTHHDEIKDALVTGWGYARDVMNFIVSNKEVLLALAAARAGNQFAGGVVAGLGPGKLADGASDEEKKKHAASTEKFQKMGQAVDAATLAIMTWSIALDQLSKLLEEQREAEEDRMKGTVDFKRQLNEAAAAGDVGKVETLKNTKALGGSGQDVDDASIDQAMEIAKTNAQTRAKMIKLESEIHLAAVDVAAQNTADAYQKATMSHDAAVQAHAVGVAEASASKMIQAYNVAIQNQQFGVAQYIAMTIEGSVQLQEAFLTSGKTIEGGIEQFGALLVNKSGEFAKKVGAMSGQELPGKGAKMNFNLTGSGSVTINVKQDFRNQDPDRVAIAFQRDVQKAAERRYQASTSTPFGT